MNFESRFLSDKNNSISSDKTSDFTGLQPLHNSKSAFFRLFIAKHLGRKIILKTLQEKYETDPIAIAQLNKEFQTLFPLNHPNIAQAFRLTEINRDVPAIEMEWCDGTDVRTLINNSISANDAVEIIKGIISGLTHIHHAGIVHRDIKPENVMFDPFRKVVKIIDFGCAYSIGATTLQGPNGTPSYTPSDKFSPDSQPEPTDDLYALGVMASELADKIGINSKADKNIKKAIQQFANLLVAKKYQSAQTASQHFNKLLFQRNKSKALLISSTLIFLCLIIALIFISRRSSQSAPQSQTPATGADTAITSTPIQSQTSSLNSTPVIPTHTEQPAESSAKQAESKEELFKRAFYAGQLLRDAESPDAPLATKMDAFVINFSDSIYKADNLFHQLPSHLSEQEMRDKAKHVANIYQEEMLKSFSKNFAGIKSESRILMLFEGRFLATLQTYHHNPYAKKSETDSSASTQ